MLSVFLLFTQVVKSQEIRFIQNAGQWPKQVLFKADIPGGSLYITAKGLVYGLYDEAAMHRAQHNKSEESIKAHAIAVDFIQASPQLQAVGVHPFLTSYNFYLGNNPANWATGVKAYQQVVLKNVYPNIDFVIEGQNGSVKTNFILRKNASTQAIKIHYRGANQLYLSNEELHVTHTLGEIKEAQPESFVKQLGASVPVGSRYVLNQDTVQFWVDDWKVRTVHDTLVIDPSVVFSTFSGSVADNFGFTSTFDKNGNAYGGGTVYASNFPVTTGAYQLSFSGGSDFEGSGARDVGILKFSPNGTQLLYATYLGGSSNEQPHSMSCDANGNLFILGTTTSFNFPMLQGFDMSFGGNHDLFIACLSANGNALLRSTYYGGSASDGLNVHVNTNDKRNQLQYNYGDEFRGDIRLDTNGLVYVASTTCTTSGLSLVNATQPTYGGGQQDGLLLVFNPTLNNLLFGTYIGGSNADAAYGLRINNGKVYVTGGTLSTNLPKLTTNGTFLYHGGVDGYLAQFSISGTTIIHDKTLYIGTNAYDQSYFVFTDNQNRVYVTGQTQGAFVRVGNVYYEINGRQFITVLDESLTTIVLQSAFGAGTPYPKLSPSAFMVDDCDRVYLSGWGGSSNNSHNPFTSNTIGLVTTNDAFQRNTDGSDFYLIIFNKSLQSIGYATFFGGPNSAEHVDGGTSHFDEAGVVYQSVCAGCGGLSDFPTTTGAFSRTNNGKRTWDPTVGGCNNAVFKFNARPTPLPPTMKDTLLTITVTDTLSYEFDITDANLDSIYITGTSGSWSALTAPNQVRLDVLQRAQGLLKIRLTWLSACSFKGDTLRLNLALRDNACEGWQTGSGAIRVYIKPMPTSLVQPTCLRRSGESAVNLTWNSAWNTAPNARYIKELRVLRSVNQSGDTVVQTIANAQGGGSFFDVGLDSISTRDYCYKLATVNLCDEVMGISLQSCLQLDDTSLTKDFVFARDTFYVVAAGDTLNVDFRVKDMKVIQTIDSLFISYKGTLLNTAKVSHTNGANQTQLNVWFSPTCSQVGDTFRLSFKIQDARCPIPRKDTGVFYVVVLPAHPAQSQPLNCIKNLTGEQVSLSWRFENPLKYLSTYQLIQRTPNQQFQTIGTFSAVHSQDVIQTVPNKLTDTTCFALVAYNYCNKPTDTSNFACVPWAESDYPKPVLPHYVTVVNNKHIELSWRNDSLPMAQIYRVNPTTGVRTFLREITTEPTDSVWVDEQVDVHKQSYCYAIDPINACGLRPKTGGFACSILLSGKSYPFEHTMRWNTYTYFATGTQQHQLFKRDLTETQYSLFRSGMDLNTDSVWDNNLNKETGKFYYVVKATANWPESYTSLSNSIELIQAPLLHVPNAYSPNFDQINDSWNIVPVFVKDYHLRLYNRWGQLVYETKDKHELVESTGLNGDLLPVDVYVYVITYTGFDESFKQVTGNVTILK